MEVVAKLLQKGRQQCKEVAGKEPATIAMSLRMDALEWLLANLLELQLALSGFPGQIRAEKMSHPALCFLDQQEWRPWPNVQSRPLPEAQTVFTDAGWKTWLAVCVWQKDSSWHHHKIQGMAEDSLQALELWAVIWALGQWRDEDLNIVSDSLYVVGVVQLIEEALLRMPKRNFGKTVYSAPMNHKGSNSAVLHYAYQKPSNYVRLGEGNDRADRLVTLSSTAPVDSFEMAWQSHSMFHQSTKMLKRQFQLSWADAQGIVKSCD
ncbi:hypothetical protein DUI87_26319 [Hirundo rustica rustica]|uniref:Integrase-type domain-containing protein n=1 Tax=Hirundo rustica rustica TaxID=333673 RepID=A0A3M0J7X8_HIRRU|nr:hypothetical protein DUI87_26319 [Hirundo rustica rustica]